MTRLSEQLRNSFGTATVSVLTSTGVLPSLDVACSDQERSGKGGFKGQRSKVKVALCTGTFALEPGES